MDRTTRHYHGGEVHAAKQSGFIWPLSYPAAELRGRRRETELTFMTYPRAWYPYELESGDASRRACNIPGQHPSTQRNPKMFRNDEIALIAETIDLASE